MKHFFFLLLLCAFFSCTPENTTPTSVKITNIQLTSFPSDNGGSLWDASGGTDPDPFISINQGITAHKNTFYTNYYDGATNSIIVSYSTSFPYTISTPNESWTFGLWDYDGSASASEYMGGLTFKFSDYASSKPATITVTAGGITMKIFVEWTF